MFAKSLKSNLFSYEYYDKILYLNNYRDIYVECSMNIDAIKSLERSYKIIFVSFLTCMELV